MAFERGTSLNLADLQSKIASFISANGWTLDRNADNRIHAHNGNFYIHTLFDTQGIRLTAGAGSGAGYNASNAYNQQPGSASVATAGAIVGARIAASGIADYDFFADADSNIVLMFRGLNDWDNHVGFGRLKKAGVYDGGEYFFGTMQNSLMSSAGGTWTLRGVQANTLHPFRMGQRSSATAPYYPAWFVRLTSDFFTGWGSASGRTIGVTSNYPNPFPTGTAFPSAANGYTGCEVFSSEAGENYTPSGIAANVTVDGTGYKVYTVTLNTPSASIQPRPGYVYVLKVVAGENQGYVPLGEIPQIGIPGIVLGFPRRTETTGIDGITRVHFDGYFVRKDV